MYRYIFLLPLYNDWDSFILLANKINDQMKILDSYAEILVVNDKSSNKSKKLIKPSNIKNIKVLNLNTNLGSQKAISIGLQYLKSKDEKTIITILDSDGEDDVTKVPYMIQEAKKNKERVIVSTRTKRQENFFFKILYFLHKLLTFAFTLNWISYGNFSSFCSSQLEKILSNSDSWLALSACLAKNCEIIKFKAERKKRLIGVSKLSFAGLMFHSLRVNTVFIIRSFTLSTLYIFLAVILFSENLKFMIFLIFIIACYELLLIITLIINKQGKFHNYKNYIEKID